MRLLENNSDFGPKDDGSNELNPAQTSGNSPPLREANNRRLSELSQCSSHRQPYEQVVNRLAADRQKMATYIARSLPDEGVRVVLPEWASEYSPTIAVLTPLWNEGEVEILIETNDPEVVDLEAVYDHFRWREMTSKEQWRHLTHVSPSMRLRRRDSNQPLVPHWDADLRTLFFDGQIVKQFKQPARNQVTVLAAFDEESWPLRIDDPLYGPREPSKRLNETIDELNQSHKTRGLIRFHGDGTGNGIVWRRLSDR